MSSIEASAPGSVMIAGEHAVLHGSKAIAMAIDKRLSVKLTPREDGQWQVRCQFGEILDKAQNIPCTKPWQWAQVLINTFKNKFPQGMNIAISSEIHPEYGLGSSAALLVAGSAVLHKAAYSNILSAKDHFKLCKKLLHKVQGKGSGTDLAASIYGGVIVYNPKLASVTRLRDALPHHLVYSGHKTPTAQVIAKLDAIDNAHQQDLYKQISELIEPMAKAIQDHDQEILNQIVTKHQQLMQKLGLCTEAIDAILFDCTKNQLAAKISGSGLGDCVIIFDKIFSAFPHDKKQRRLGIHSLSTQTCPQGVRFENC